MQFFKQNKQMWAEGDISLYNTLKRNNASICQSVDMYM